MKKIKIQRGCLWIEGRLFKMGDVVEVNDKTAAELAKDINGCYVAIDQNATAKTTKEFTDDGIADLTTLPSPDFTGNKK